MKTHIVLAIDNRRKKEDGTCSVLLRIIHYRASSQITTGVYVKEKDWDSKKRVILPSYKGTESVTRLNNFLQKKKALATDLVTKLEETKKLDSLTVFELKELIENKPQKESFFSYTESIIIDLIDAKRIGNARAYKSTLGVLKTYCNEKDLTFHELNTAFLKRFEIAHLKKGNSLNGLAVYMRTIRAIYNIAIKAGHVDREHYPFANYSIKTVKTRKRAISLEAIQRIAQEKLTKTHPLFHTRNYFMVSFYLRGMSFADLAQLKVSDIIEGRIYYQRKKTDKPYNIKVTEEPQKILDLYLSGKQKDDYIFPIIKRTDLQEQYKDIQWARQRFNLKLKKLATLCKISENVTSYVSRHSFATRAKNLGIPIASISDMLGHENIKTTEVYLDTLPSDMLDDFHARVIK
jgi:site-specific recombinase XerD